jgi:hypothetical protein
LIVRQNSIASSKGTFCSLSICGAMPSAHHSKVLLMKRPSALTWNT